MASDCISTSNESCLTNASTLAPASDESDGNMVGIVPEGLYMTVIWLILLLGLTGNALVFVLMQHVSHRRLSFSVYLRCLAVFDSLVLITICTEDILDHQFHELTAFLSYSEFTCKVWTYIGRVARFISPWFVVILSMDRYFTVVLPRFGDVFCTLKTAIIASVTASIFAALEGIPFLVHEKINAKSGTCDFIGAESLENYYTVRNLFFQSALPCFLILGLNVHIIIMFRRRQKFREGFVSLDNSKKPPKDKVTASLIAVTLSAFLALVPMAMLEVIEFYWERNYRKYVDSLPAGVAPKEKPGYLEKANNAWPLFNLINLLNFCQNFYVMMATGPRYRRLLMSILCKCVPGSSAQDWKDVDSSQEMEEAHFVQSNNIVHYAAQDNARVAGINIDKVDDLDPEDERLL